MSSSDSSVFQDGANLREREKELDFVYAVASLLSKPNLTALEAAEGAASRFAEAMEFSELVTVTVSIGAVSAAYPPGTAAPGASALSMDARAGNSTECRIRVAYGCRAPAAAFSARELALCESAAALLAVAAERIESDERERSNLADLERKNIALSVLLSRIEAEKAAIGEAIRAAVDERVVPLVARLSSAAGDPSEAALLEARIRRELDSATSRGTPGDVDPRRRLSVRELEICELVASGLSSKEIAGRLSIARATVERHRHNARRKLGLPEREGSIASALRRDPAGYRPDDL